MTRSLRNKKNKSSPGKPVRWYMIRTVFYLLLVAYGFVMFFMGFIVGEYL